LKEAKTSVIGIVTPRPKIRGNKVAIRINDVYTRGEYQHIHAKSKVT